MPHHAVVRLRVAQGASTLRNANRYAGYARTGWFRPAVPPLSVLHVHATPRRYLTCHRTVSRTYLPSALPPFATSAFGALRAFAVVHCRGWQADTLYGTFLETLSGLRSAARLPMRASPRATLLPALPTRLRRSGELTRARFLQHSRPPGRDAVGGRFACPNLGRASVAAHSRCVHEQGGVERSALLFPQPGERCC